MVTLWNLEIGNGKINLHFALKIILGWNNDLYSHGMVLAPQIPITSIFIEETINYVMRK